STDVNAGGTHWRVLTFPATLRVNVDQVTQGAVQLARPLNGTDHILANLRLILFLLFLGGIALAAALGRLAARRVLAPLSEVAQTATYIGETDDLSKRITVHADDEVGQLATRFNAMLEHLEGSRAALDESVRAQRQLEPVTLEGVAERLERAVNNLLDNAARHSPPDGTVEIDVDSAGVRVRDHGSGIDEEDLPHVFDRFYRGANVRGQQGSGLGLSIVRQVTEQHGASVSAANATDVGAVFT